MNAVYEIEKQCFRYLSTITISNIQNDIAASNKSEEAIKEMK